VFRFALGMHAIFLAGWALIALKALPAHPFLLVAILMTSGAMSALLGTSGTRILMGVLPEMGRAHFFALNMVTGSLCMAVAPIMWGVILDAMEEFRVDFHGMEWNRYSVYFVVITVLIALCQWPARRLLEKPTHGS